METNFAARLAEPFVLALLARRPLHGYGLLQELEEAFGADSIAKARVYQILRRLEEDGLVAPREEGNRKVYALTDDGRTALAAMGSQTPAFFKLLGMLFPDMDVAVHAGDGNGQGDLPRDGARTEVACPGCASLRISMERTLPEQALTIHVARPGEAAQHHAGCVVGLALRRLAASMLP